MKLFKSFPWFSIFSLTILWAGQGVCFGYSQSDSCDSVIKAVAEKYKVPEEIMRAIAIVESGREIDGKMTPWPWTVNHNGEGYWFDSTQSVVAFAENLRSSGFEDFDVGCFQINLRWHSDAFSSLEDAFDPFSNASYAAEFLSELVAQNGNWPDSVADYHSKRFEAGQTYLAKVQKALETVRNGSGEIDPNPVENTSNGFPLLVKDVPARGPSLVPVLSSGQPLFVRAP